MIRTLTIETSGQGLYEITGEVSGVVHSEASSDGLCTLFCQHTSASLTIQENADPTAKSDLEEWLMRLVPEDDPHFTHTYEGPDDMPAHIKTALTSTSLSIPVNKGTLMLGTWQGIYLWEHRSSKHRRKVIVHLS